MSEIDWDKVYCGLDPSDWHALKNLVLDVAHSNAVSVTPPEHLSDHDVVQLLRQYLQTRDSDFLDQAARALVPLYPDKAWLALEKS